jgi:hypothetical protein
MASGTLGTCISLVGHDRLHIAWDLEAVVDAATVMLILFLVLAAQSLALLDHYLSLSLAHHDHCRVTGYQPSLHPLLGCS